MSEIIKKKLTRKRKARKKPASPKSVQKPIKVRTFHRLTTAEKLQAHGLAMELLAQMQTVQTVKAAMRQKYAISMPQATRIVRTAQEAVTQAIAHNVDRERAKHIRQLEALYRRALKAERLSVCSNILAQLGKARGAEAPQQLEVTHKSEATEMDERSEDELQHYIEHACWPEEMPAKVVAEVKQETAADPLASLH